MLYAGVLIDHFQLADKTSDKTVPYEDRRRVFMDKQYRRTTLMGLGLFAAFLAVALWMALRMSQIFLQPIAANLML